MTESSRGEGEVTPPPPQQPPRLPSIFHQSQRQGTAHGASAGMDSSSFASPGSELQTDGQAGAGSLDGHSFLNMLSSMGSLQLPPSFWAEQAAAVAAAAAGVASQPPATQTAGTPQPPHAHVPAFHAQMPGAGEAAPEAPSGTTASGQGGLMEGMARLRPALPAWWWSGHAQAQVQAYGQELQDASNLPTMPHQSSVWSASHQAPAPASMGCARAGAPLALLSVPRSVHAGHASTLGGAAGGGASQIKQETHADIWPGCASDAFMRACLGNWPPAGPASCQQDASRDTLPPPPPLNSGPYGALVNGPQPTFMTCGDPNGAFALTHAVGSGSGVRARTPQVPATKRIPVSGGPTWLPQQAQQQRHHHRHQKETHKQQQKSDPQLPHPQQQPEQHPLKQHQQQQPPPSPSVSHAHAPHAPRPLRPKPRPMPIPAASPFQKAATQEGTPAGMTQLWVPVNDQGQSGAGADGGSGSGDRAAGAGGGAGNTHAGTMPATQPFVPFDTDQAREAADRADTDGIPDVFGSGSSGYGYGYGYDFGDTGCMSSRYPWQSGGSLSLLPSTYLDDLLLAPNPPPAPQPSSSLLPLTEPLIPTPSSTMARQASAAALLRAASGRGATPGMGSATPLPNMSGAPSMHMSALQIPPTLGPAGQGPGVSSGPGRSSGSRLIHADSMALIAAAFESLGSGMSLEWPAMFPSLPSMPSAQLQDNGTAAAVQQNQGGGATAAQQRGSQAVVGAPLQLPMATATPSSTAPPTSVATAVAATAPASANAATCPRALHQPQPSAELQPPPQQLLQEEGGPVPADQLDHSTLLPSGAIPSRTAAPTAHPTPAHPTTSWPVQSAEGATTATAATAADAVAAQTQRKRRRRGQTAAQPTRVDPGAGAASGPHAVGAEDELISPHLTPHLSPSTDPAATAPAPAPIPCSPAGSAGKDAQPSVLGAQRTPLPQMQDASSGPVVRPTSLGVMTHLAAANTAVLQAMAQAKWRVRKAAAHATTPLPTGLAGRTLSQLERIAAGEDVVEGAGACAGTPGGKAQVASGLVGEAVTGGGKEEGSAVMAAAMAAAAAAMEADHLSAAAAASSGPVQQLEAKSGPSSTVCARGSKRTAGWSAAEEAEGGQEQRGGEEEGEEEELKDDELKEDEDMNEQELWRQNIRIMNAAKVPLPPSMLNPPPPRPSLPPGQKPPLPPTARDLTAHLPAEQRQAAMTRIRREKNRLAARKCRAKKIASMVETESRLKELAASNEELRVQLAAFQALFAQEVQRRELLKNIILLRWGESDTTGGTARLAAVLPPGLRTAADLISAIESDALVVEQLCQAMQAQRAQASQAQDGHVTTAGGDGVKLELQQQVAPGTEGLPHAQPHGYEQQAYGLQMQVPREVEPEGAHAAGPSQSAMVHPATRARQLQHGRTKLAAQGSHSPTLFQAERQSGQLAPAGTMGPSASRTTPSPLERQLRVMGSEQQARGGGPSPSPPSTPMRTPLSHVIPSSQTQGLPPRGVPTAQLAAPTHPSSVSPFQQPSQPPAEAANRLDMPPPPPPVAPSAQMGQQQSNMVTARSLRAPAYAPSTRMDSLDALLMSFDVEELNRQPTDSQLPTTIPTTSVAPVSASIAAPNPSCKGGPANEGPPLPTDTVRSPFHIHASAGGHAQPEAEQHVHSVQVGLPDGPAYGPRGMDCAPAPDTAARSDVQAGSATADGGAAAVKQSQRRRQQQRGVTMGAQMGQQSTGGVPCGAAAVAGRRVRTRPAPSAAEDMKAPKRR